MFTALTSLALLGLVIVNGLEFSNRMDEMLARAAATAPSRNTPA
jgi:hypothetical protein